MEVRDAMSERSREQQLIDAGFAMVGLLFDPEFHQNFLGLGHEGRMKWVARQYREIGFPTRPMGCSWGVLCEPDRPRLEHRVVVIEANRPD